MCIENTRTIYCKGSPCGGSPVVQRLCSTRKRAQWSSCIFEFTSIRSAAVVAFRILSRAKSLPSADQRRRAVKVEHASKLGQDADAHQADQRNTQYPYERDPFGRCA